MGTVALREAGFAARDGRRVANDLGETDGPAVGELEATAAGTTATLDGATSGAPWLGPGVDQPPSGKDVPPLQAARDRISAGSSRRSGRMTGRDRLRDSSGIAAVLTDAR